MSTLNKLNLTNAVKPNAMPAIQHRRNKLSLKIWEQIQLAEAQKTGGTYTSKRIQTVKTLDGEKKTMEVQKRVRPWWFTNEQGKTCISVKYGAKTVPLAKDKTAVEIANKDELVKTLELIKSAIDQGELDQEIEKVSGSIRARFKR